MSLITIDATSTYRPDLKPNVIKIIENDPHAFPSKNARYAWFTFGFKNYWKSSDFQELLHSVYNGQLPADTSELAWIKKGNAGDTETFLERAFQENGETMTTINVDGYFEAFVNRYLEDLIPMIKAAKSTKQAAVLDGVLGLGNRVPDTVLRQPIANSQLQAAGGNVLSGSGSILRTIKAASPQSNATGPVDNDGNVFNQSIHKVNAQGNPVLNANGTLRKIKGRKPSQNKSASGNQSWISKPLNIQPLASTLYDDDVKDSLIANLKAQLLELEG